MPTTPWNQISRKAREPVFGDNSENYNMSVPIPTLEMIRIKELRASTLKMIKQMQDRGLLLPEDSSQALIEMEEAWRVVWNEYSELYKALEGEDIFRGNPAYYRGQTINTPDEKEKLIAGDFIRVHCSDSAEDDNAIWEIIKIPPERVMYGWKHKMFESPINSCWTYNAPSYKWEYLGNRNDGMFPFDCPTELAPEFNP